MLQFRQFLLEQSLRSKQMQEIDALIPQYIKHFDSNPVPKRNHVRIPHPKYPEAALQINSMHIAHRKQIMLSLSYDGGSLDNIKDGVKHSIAFALASAHHMLKKDPEHVFSMIPMTQSSKGKQSEAHTRLYTALINHINSPDAGPNLSQFSGEVQSNAGLVHHAPVFKIRARDNATV